MPFGLISAGASIGGALIGNSEAADDRRAAMDAISDSVSNIKNTKIPTIEEQRITLEKLKSAGLLTPDQEQTILQDPSLMMQITTDPRLKDAQMGALAQLQQTGRTGLNISDEAALNQINQNTATQARGRNDAILQNMAQKGQGGSGAQLAAQLSNAQAATNNAQNNGLNVAAQAQQRALQAMAQSGQMASGIQNQEFGQDAAKAQAADQINRFNSANRQQVSNQNTGLRNAAQQYNLGNNQRIMDSNVGISNQQEMHNKALYQQQFNNEMMKSQALAGVLNNQANAYNNRANQTAQMWAGIGQGVGNAFNSFSPSNAPMGSSLGGGNAGKTNAAPINYGQNQSYGGDYSGRGGYGYEGGQDYGGNYAGGYGDAGGAESGGGGMGGMSNLAGLAVLA